MQMNLISMFEDKIHYNFNSGIITQNMIAVLGPVFHIMCTRNLAKLALHP
jgi:hypothetical protein